MVTFQTFWKGKRVFLTGHTGFKGSWLCLLLEHLGARVTGYSLGTPTQPSLFELASLKDSMESVHGDVRDYPLLLKTMQQAQPDVALHLAAQAIVLTSYREPVETYSTNVMGTVHFLEAARHVPSLRTVVVITSDKCYENREWPWGYREDEPMGGHDPYSNSKGCAELVVSAYRRSFFEPGNGKSVASARAGNVIGGGDWADNRIIPDCMRAVLAGKPIQIRNPNAIRPWQHVLEPLYGYLLLAHRLWESPEKFSEGWNFGSDDSDVRSVGWLAQKIVELWGKDACWQTTGQAQAHEAHHLKLDCSKAKAVLNWMPRTNLSLAMQWVVDWYKRYQAGEKPYAICRDQIFNFMALQGSERYERSSLSIL